MSQSTRGPLSGYFPDIISIMSDSKLFRWQQEKAISLQNQGMRRCHTCGAPLTSSRSDGRLTSQAAATSEGNAPLSPTGPTGEATRRNTRAQPRRVSTYRGADEQVKRADHGGVLDQEGNGPKS